MKTLFKCLFFTLLVLKIYSANASSYLYTINYNDTISACNTNPSNDTDHLQACKEINISHYDIQGEPSHIAISPNGAYAYIATWGYDRSGANYVYACLIDDRTGRFEYCTKHEFPKQEYGSIQDITVNATSDRIYILFANVSKENKIVMCSSENFECTDLNSKFFGIIKSIRIAHDNRYAYLIGEYLDNPPRRFRSYNHINEPHKGLIFYTCPILENGTYARQACIPKSIFDGYIESTEGILDMAVTNKGEKDLPLIKKGEKLYVVVSNTSAALRTNINNCDLNSIFSTATHIKCFSSYATMKAIYAPMPIPQEIQITFDNTYKYAYFLTKDADNTTKVFKCKHSNDGSFRNCYIEAANINRVKAIAYRRDRPNDNDDYVTLHYKPQVESKVESK